MNADSFGALEKVAVLIRAEHRSPSQTTSSSEKPADEETAVMVGAWKEGKRARMSKVSVGSERGRERDESPHDTLLRAATLPPHHPVRRTGNTGGLNFTPSHQACELTLCLAKTTRRRQTACLLHNADIIIHKKRLQTVSRTFRDVLSRECKPQWIKPVQHPPHHRLLPHLPLVWLTRYLLLRAFESTPPASTPLFPSDSGYLSPVYSAPATLWRSNE